jgi:hypothetical protein
MVLEGRPCRLDARVYSLDNSLDEIVKHLAIVFALGNFAISRISVLKEAQG